MRTSNILTTIVICFLCITLLSVITSNDINNNVNHNITTTTTTTTVKDIITTPEGDNYVLVTMDVSATAETGYCDDSDYAVALELDDDIFNVHFIKNSAYYRGHISTSTFDVRLYSSSEGDGSTMTIVSTKKIVSILIMFDSGSGAYKLNGTSYTANDTYHLIDDYRIEIQNVDTEGNKVVIQSIMILYEN